MAVMADMGASLLVIANGLRLLAARTRQRKIAYGRCTASDNAHRETRSPSTASTRSVRVPASTTSPTLAACQGAQHVAAERRVRFLIDIEGELLVDVDDQRQAIDLGRAIRKLSNGHRRGP
jgi:hypothetical protein